MRSTLYQRSAEVKIEATRSPVLRCPGRSGRVSKTRWWIVWTLFFSTVTNYISRQSFSVLSPMITAQYHLTHTDLAKILGSFQISYAITWLVGGIVLDAVGSRDRPGDSGNLVVGDEYSHRPCQLRFRLRIFSIHAGNRRGFQLARSQQSGCRMVSAARNEALRWRSSTAAPAWAERWRRWSFL